VANDGVQRISPYLLAGFKYGASGNSVQAARADIFNGIKRRLASDGVAEWRIVQLSDLLLCMYDGCDRAQPTPYQKHYGFDRWRARVMITAARLLCATDELNRAAPSVGGFVPTDGCRMLALHATTRRHANVFLASQGFRTAARLGSAHGNAGDFGAGTSLCEAGYPFCSLVVAPINGHFTFLVVELDLGSIARLHSRDKCGWNFGEQGYQSVYAAVHDALGDSEIVVADPARMRVLWELEFAVEGLTLGDSYPQFYGAGSPI